MAIKPEIMRFFSDEICKIAMLNIKIPGYQGSSLAAKVQKANGQNAGLSAYSSKALNTKPTGVAKGGIMSGAPPTGISGTLGLPTP